MIAVIDNYDSFTYNLVQYLGTLGAPLEVWRNDAVTPAELEAKLGRPLRFAANLKETLAALEKSPT